MKIRKKRRHITRRELRGTIENGKQFILEEVSEKGGRRGGGGAAWGIAVKVR